MAAATYRHCSTTSESSLSEGLVDYYNPPTDKYSYGDYKEISSNSESDKRYTDVETINSASSLGKYIWIRGRVASVRGKGNACFLVVRSKAQYTIQVCHFKGKTDASISKSMIKFANNIQLESIVDIYGKVVAADVHSCTQNSVEIAMEKIYVVSRAPTKLPFLLDDASRSEEEIALSAETERPFAKVDQDIRLNNRWLDLRVPANNAIIRIRSGIMRLFREALYAKNFTEISSPKLISGQSEGGSEVFTTDYFGQPACLAQSPQLYKQMALSADLHRVFEVGPVFRAENSKTRRHLCEFTGLDLEMTISSHYNEVLSVLHDLFRHIFDGLEKHYAQDLAIVRQQYPSERVQFTEDPLIVHWPEAMEMLVEAGEKPDPTDDLTTAHELLLGKCVKEKFKSDFFILDKYPLRIRPFYTMPCPNNSLFSNSYDLFIRGQEICSGAQRCHNADMLEKRIAEKGIDPRTLQFYVDSFRHGVSPHGGAGIGLERVVFLYLGLDNVRKASLFPRDPGRCSP
eukprot:CAMPEP_0185041882 /NCGR_PEP_ID=MMETSP1103-20130426/41734_1 /TAXON_ID=36769 /ORGANISM="Paraphysomonas bandaiensis, Strain Caron Lab Isolate" /LENGTH=514 /DNA_ID=CAMNT_0027581811 /DNA_START=100 /DNA_END=1645 /DNA_ORIENTATION=-